ncbi:MAG: HNH endonuclease [Lachnospiraceae bacterium]|nr:HNH endonuclease [Lachnospiraceae bacterium]
MLSKNFIPTKPFPEFKWKWACLQCTEGLNDPVVLLGVLFRMRKLEPLGVKYSSPEFARELVELSNDIKDTDIGVDLARRTGERNLIRNSGQYWRAVGLIAPGDRTGKIRLTEFGRKVADHDISQTEFAAITIQTFKLPNPQVQNEDECRKWLNSGIVLYPLRLLLMIECELQKIEGNGYITTEELTKIIIPLSGCSAELQDYINFILWFRAGEISLIGWPDCCPEANDMRIAREYLLFLSNYGYVGCPAGDRRLDERYILNSVLIDEIQEIITTRSQDENLLNALNEIRSTEVTSEFERKRIQETKRARPNQANFRKAVLKACQRCIITNVTMPEILEAAHIKPFKYNGEDTIANGFAMRTDIHTLFDTGHLRISVDGKVELSQRARMDYGATIPPSIVLPSFTNRDFLKWRWDNYNGI